MTTLPDLIMRIMTILPEDITIITTVIIILMIILPVLIMKVVVMVEEIVGIVATKEQKEIINQL